jgi:hypothetical protein
MKDTSDATVGTQRADDEVELTAEDLRALSVGSTSESRRDSIAASGEAPATVLEQSDSAVPKAISRVGLPLAVVIAVAWVAGGHTYLKGRGTDQSATAVVAQSANQLQLATAKDEEEPVRIANPFDATEVFELPADTTEGEAREAVAGFLIERAMSRQARVGGNPARDH